MVLTDLIIGMHDVVFYTWGAFVLVGFIGMRLRGNRTPGRIFTSAVLSGTLFFVISNFGVWLAWYPHTWQGFADCYIRAIPFFRNSLAGNLVFTAVLFGLYELARKLASESRYKAVLLTD